MSNEDDDAIPTTEFDNPSTTKIRRQEDEGQIIIEHHDWKTTLAGISGNALEWYDFSVFGYFSDVIGKVFFPPNQEGHAALIESFAVFGVAFLVRPIGGLIFGHIGDSQGRKSALENSILLMCFPTIALGCIPSYETIGWLSSVLLIICRILQGLSVGGQFMSSVVFTLEGRHSSTWGFWGASVFSFATVGTILGSLFSYILRETLTQEELESWGWRIPFLFGALGLLPGAYLKYRSREHPIPTQEEEDPSSQFSDNNDGSNNNSGVINRTSSGIEGTFHSSNRRALIAASLVPGFAAATYYIVFVWLVIFMESIVIPPVPHAFAINTAVAVIGIFFLFIGGWFFDWIQKPRWIMFLSSLSIAIAAPLFIHLIGEGSNAFLTFILQTILAFLLSIWNGAMIPWLVRRFPPHLRLTSISLSYNLAVGICGGFAPALATLLVDRFSTASPGYIVTGLAVFAWLGLYLGGGNMRGSDIGGEGSKDVATSMEMLKYNERNNDETEMTSTKLSPVV